MPLSSTAVPVILEADLKDVPEIKERLIEGVVESAAVTVIVFGVGVAAPIAAVVKVSSPDSPILLEESVL